MDSSEKRAVNSGRAPNLGHVLDVNDEVQNGAFTSHADDKHWGKANLLLAVIGGLLFLAAGVTMLLHSRRRNRLSTGIGANGKHGGKGELAMMPLLRSSNHDM